MMIALGFVGVVTTKETVLDKITKYLREGVNPRTFKHWDMPRRGNQTATLHHFNNFANYLYGYTILNSSATPCLYVVSKRTCEGQCGDIHTQLWSGYAASLADELFQKNENKETTKIMVVDLGSGEFKRFVCQIQKGEGVELLKEHKDKTRSEGYAEALRDIVTVLKEKFEEKKKCEHSGKNEPKFPKGADIPKGDYFFYWNVLTNCNLPT
jgi:hypothetical protein